MNAYHIRGSDDWANWLESEARRRGYRTAVGKPNIQNVLDDALAALARQDGLTPPPRRRWAKGIPVRAVPFSG